jgi:hypothetical protein
LQKADEKLNRKLRSRLEGLSRLQNYPGSHRPRHGDISNGIVIAISMEGGRQLSELSST